MKHAVATVSPEVMEADPRSLSFYPYDDFAFSLPETPGIVLAAILLNWPPPAGKEVKSPGLVDDIFDCAEQMFVREP